MPRGNYRRRGRGRPVRRQRLQAAPPNEKVPSKEMTLGKLGLKEPQTCWVRTVLIGYNAGITATVLETVNTNGLLFGTAFTYQLQSAELANFARSYSKYRVLKYRGRWTAVARKTTSLLLAVNHTASATAPFATATYLTATPGLAQESTVTRLVPGSNTSPSVISGAFSYDIEKLLGDEEIEADVNYTGTISTTGVFTDPADLTYMYFAYSNPANVIMVAGETPLVELVFEQYVHFYESRYK